MASVETLDIMATVAAMSVADLHLGPVILLSCEGRRPFWPGGTPFRQRKSGVVLMQINGAPMHGEEPATTGPGVGRLRHLIASSKEFGFSVSTADLMAAVAFQAPTRMVFRPKISISKSSANPCRPS